MWFDNPNADQISIRIQKEINKIPTYKWVTLVYQICSRMSVISDTFQTALKNLIIKMTVDHPYHCLYQLFALRNADAVNPSAKNQYQDKQKAAEGKSIG